jgi:hypothetical protein
VLGTKIYDLDGQELRPRSSRDLILVRGRGQRKYDAEILGKAFSKSDLKSLTC